MKQFIKISILICTLLTADFLTGINFSLAYEREIKSLADTLARDIAGADKKIIAVVDFTDLQGNVTELGRFLAEELSVALAVSDQGFEVVDRSHLKVLLQEHKLALTGLIDPSTARKLGEIAGADALVTGTITPLGNTVRLAVKLLDTGTAKIAAASTTNIDKTKEIAELLSKGIGSASGFVPGAEMNTDNKSMSVKEINRTLNYQGISFKIVTVTKNKEFKNRQAPKDQSFLIVNLNARNTLGRQVILFYDEEIRLLNGDGGVIALETYKIENNFDPGFKSDGYFIFVVDKNSAKFKLEFGKASLPKVNMNLDLNPDSGE